MGGEVPHLSWKRLLRMEAAANKSLELLEAPESLESPEGGAGVDMRDTGGMEAIGGAKGAGVGAGMGGTGLLRHESYSFIVDGLASSSSSSSSNGPSSIKPLWLARYCYYELASGNNTPMPSLSIAQTCVAELCTLLYANGRKSATRRGRLGGRGGGGGGGEKTMDEKQASKRRG